MAHCVDHRQCPRCARNGNDRSHNNLAVYSDGSLYCFSCHYFVSGTGLERIREPEGRTVQALALPHDAEPDLSEKATGFLSKYGITGRDIQRNTLLWSEHWQRLIFPYFGDNGLLGWQGRYLGTDNRAKWYSQGNLRELSHVVGNKNSGQIVLTEDIISAIKVSHCPTICAAPLFGSHVDVAKVLTFRKKYGTIVVMVWLDFDKAKESMMYSKKLRDLGIQAHSIITPLDPKCYTDEEIAHYVQCFASP